MLPGVTQPLVDRLEAAVCGDEWDKPTWYGWAPLPLLDFYDGMRVAREALGPGRHSFLDVGAGIGSKVFAAHWLGFEASGVEHHEPYVDVARRLFPEVTVTLGTALDFEDYGSFDVVYCYRIAVNPDLQVTVNRYVADRMRRGAVFFSAGGPYPDWLEHVEGQVWRTR